MDALIIEGPAHLEGEVQVSGSKNTALPFIFSSLLFDKKMEFQNVPRLWDVETALKILEYMGSAYEWNKDAGTLSVFPHVKKPEAPYDWVRKMRAGILALGPLLARCGEARVSLPGGCAIGARPVNFHLSALQQMGVRIEVKEGYIHAVVPSRLYGTSILFPEVTVTGTENLLMTATCAEGETVLENSATEPEVVALGKFLVECGAAIEGLGTSTIRVRGSKLSPPKIPVYIPPDRIETGTWLATAVATRSHLSITGCHANELSAVISAFLEMGADIKISPDEKRIEIAPADRYRAIQIKTHPYPGFATDMQAQIMATLCLADGQSRVRETIFENRFMHVAELRRLGAKIEILGNTAIVHGNSKLEGAPIMATDLRASASLVIAALAASGQTKIGRIYHLDRGYQKLDVKLKSLGASVKRIQE